VLFVDGHNLAFADAAARRMLLDGRPDAARIRVTEIVSVYSHSTRHKAEIVFDGTGGHSDPGKKTGRVRYRFSGAARAADAELLRLIEKSTGRREIILVTSDRHLALTAKKLGVRTIGSKEFLNETRRLEDERKATHPHEPAAKRAGPSPADVEYWLGVFSDDDVDTNKQERDPGHKK